MTTLVVRCSRCLSLATMTGSTMPSAPSNAALFQVAYLPRQQDRITASIRGFLISTRLSTRSSYTAMISKTKPRRSHVSPVQAKASSSKILSTIPAPQLLRAAPRYTRELQLNQFLRHPRRTACPSHPSLSHLTAYLRTRRTLRRRCAGATAYRRSQRRRSFKTMALRKATSRRQLMPRFRNDLTTDALHHCTSYSNNGSLPGCRHTRQSINRTACSEAHVASSMCARLSTSRTRLGSG